MVPLPVAIHESLFEGLTMSRVAYFMRKNPQFIHEVLNEYTKLNIEVIKRYNDVSSGNFNSRRVNSQRSKYCAETMGASISNRGYTYMRSLNRSSSLLESISS